ncbi:hypothetical protein FGRMN_10127 [Fusarium graminum]|nr:hypothetical protein FGRMN_10127 [Fusarium graminum]
MKATATSGSALNLAVEAFALANSGHLLITNGNLAHIARLRYGSTLAAVRTAIVHQTFTSDDLTLMAILTIDMFEDSESSATGQTVRTRPRSIASAVGLLAAIHFRSQLTLAQLRSLLSKHTFAAPSWEDLTSLLYAIHRHLDETRGVAWGPTCIVETEEFHTFRKSKYARISDSKLNSLYITHVGIPRFILCPPDDLLLSGSAGNEISDTGYLEPDGTSRHQTSRSGQTPVAESHSGGADSESR